MGGDPVPNDRDGLPGENLKRHIWAMSLSADTLKSAPSAPPADSLFSNDPHFKVSEGGPPQSNRIQD
jgi:hypothetical protein